MDAREEKKTSARLVRAGMRRSGDLVGAPPRREVSAEIVSVGHEVRGHARPRSRLDAAVVAAREDAAVAPAAHHAAHAVAAAVPGHGNGGVEWFFEWSIPIVVVTIKITIIFPDLPNG